MTRYGILKKLLSVIGKSDIVVLSGKDLCEEVYVNDFNNYLYLNNSDMMFSLGLGLAVSCDKNIFIICDSNSVLKEFSSLLQVVASKQVNIFIIVVHSTENYFFNVMTHKQAVFFDMGFKSFVIDQYFKSSQDLKNLKLFLDNTKGPAVFHITIRDTKRNKFKVLNKSGKYFVKRLNSFINKN